MTPSDHDLICRIRKRDAKAFELLFARCKERIRRHLWSIVRDDAAAGETDSLTGTDARLFVGLPLRPVPLRPPRLH